MKTITEQLVEESKGLLQRFPEPTAFGYSMANTGGVEYEVGEFLYAMVRLIKPFRILETGTHLGVSAAFMGKALVENGMGELETIEYLEHFYIQAKDLFRTLSLFEARVKPLYMNVDEYQPSGIYDIIFLDSEPERRFKELVRFYPYLKPGGYIFIHDLPPTFCKGNVNPDHPEFKDWPFGPVPEKMKHWIQDNDLRPFSFPSPRGFVGFYKTKADDYYA